MSKREIKEITIKPEDCSECTVVVSENKKRGRPKKVKEDKPKKPIGRPKSETDIKARRLLYGLTFFSKIIGLTDEEIETKKKVLMEKIKSGSISEFKPPKKQTSASDGSDVNENEIEI